MGTIQSGLSQENIAKLFEEAKELAATVIVRDSPLVFDTQERIETLGKYLDEAKGVVAMNTTIMFGKAPTINEDMIRAHMFVQLEMIGQTLEFPE